MPLLIRPETTADLDTIRQVHCLAFGQDDEARLVDVPRDGRFARAFLVAENDGPAVGHVLFIELPIITRLEWPFSGRPSFLADELVPGALEGVAGRVEYPPPFAGW